MRPFLTCLLVFLFCGALVWSVPAQTPSDQDDDVIRVDTDLTNLFFTATDKQKSFVTTLREEDLRLIEDGVPQKILTFQRETDRPLSIAFLIDVSASEERTLPQEKAAAENVFELMLELNRAHGTSLVMVTHEPSLAARAHRIMRLQDGVLTAAN